MTTSSDRYILCLCFGASQMWESQWSMETSLSKLCLLLCLDHRVEIVGVVVSMHKKR